MKKLLAILLAFLFFSCGNSSDNTITVKADPPPEVPAVDKAKAALIIGTPKRIGTIEVAEKDFPDKMNWNDARTACTTLGPHWRLPTRVELEDIFAKKDQIGGFTNSAYWTGTDENLAPNLAWVQFFYQGAHEFGKKDETYLVRAVQTF